MMQRVLPRDLTDKQQIMTKIAFVGTGFVADYYMKTLENYPDLDLECCFDRDAERLAQFSRFHDVAAADNLDDLLSRGEVDIVVNLANPQSHFEINRAALEAGRHVYCEKPLAMSADDARALGDLAASRNRTLYSAPANALSPAFVKTAEILKKDTIGRPRMIYAEMEDGPVFWDKWRSWQSASGAAWPGIHEFETGCTLEHAGYALSWLLALFGPVRHMAASNQLVFPDKGPGDGPRQNGPGLVGRAAQVRRRCPGAAELRTGDGTQPVADDHGRTRNHQRGRPLGLEFTHPASARRPRPDLAAAGRRLDRVENRADTAHAHGRGPARRLQPEPAQARVAGLSLADRFCRWYRRPGPGD